MLVFAGPFSPCSFALLTCLPVNHRLEISSSHFSVSEEDHLEEGPASPEPLDETEEQVSVQHSSGLGLNVGWRYTPAQLL